MVKKHLTKKVNKLRNKFRFIIFNDTTFAETFSLRLSLFNIYSLTGILIFVCLFLGFLITAITPLKKFVPGYDQNLRQQLVKQIILLDSLESEINRKELFIGQIKHILMEVSSADSAIPKYDNNQQDSIVQIEPVFSKSTEDSLLRMYVEQEEKFNLSSGNNELEFKLTSLYLYPPVKGILIEPMDVLEKHFGVDIVTTENAAVSAVLDGIIIFSEWTTTTGFVIHIQHANNLISVYKHNAELLKSAGEKVSAGDVIAFVGNSGELSSGPHLHFELWYNGASINPEDYIVF